MHGGTCSSQFSSRPRRFLVETRWPELRHGKRPPESTTGEPGLASSISDSHFRKTRLVPTSGHTQATTQAPIWLTRPLLRSTSTLRICSGCCFWKGSNFPSPSMRPCALVAGPPWTRWDHRAACPAQGGFGLLPLGACWLACVGKRVPG